MTHRIWIVDGQPFTTLHDAEIYLDVHYRKLWEETLTEPYPASWRHAMSRLATQLSVFDDELISLKEFQISPAPIFEAVYTAEDMIGNIEGFERDNPAHQEAFALWAKTNKQKTEAAMLEAAWAEFPFTIEEILP